MALLCIIPKTALMTAEQRECLERAGRVMARSDVSSVIRPVVKLYTPDAAATWLIAWLAPQDPDVAYGLCDLGFGLPEIGGFRLSAIKEMRGPLGMPVMRDRTFAARQSLLDYAVDAHARGRVVA